MASKKQRIEQSVNELNALQELLNMKNKLINCIQAAKKVEIKAYLDGHVPGGTKEDVKANIWQYFFEMTPKELVLAYSIFLMIENKTEFEEQLQVYVISSLDCVVRDEVRRLLGDLEDDENDE